MPAARTSKPAFATCRRPKPSIPAGCAQLLTHPVRGLDNYRELFARLQNPNGAIKIFCEVAASVTCREFADFMADYLSAGNCPCRALSQFEHHL